MAKPVKWWIGVDWAGPKPSLTTFYNGQLGISYRPSFGYYAVCKLWRWYYRATEAYDRSLPHIMIEKHGERFARVESCPTWTKYGFISAHEASIRFARECHHRIRLASYRIKVGPDGRGISVDEWEDGKRQAGRELDGR